jgi:hypothetical protein
MAARASGTAHRTSGANLSVNILPKMAVPIMCASASHPKTPGFETDGPRELEE